MGVSERPPWKNTPKKLTVRGLQLIRKMIWSPFLPSRWLQLWPTTVLKSQKSFSAKVLCRNYKEMLCFFLHELSNLTCALKHFCKFVVSGILILVFFFIVFKGKVSSSLYYLDLFHGFFFFKSGTTNGNLVSQELAGEHSFCVSPLLTRGHLYILKIFRFRSPFRFIPLTRFW